MSHYDEEREAALQPCEVTLQTDCIADLLASATSEPDFSPERWDIINKPKHYNSDPSGIEPIQITQHMSFCLGNTIKYIMRAKHKGSEIEDLKKAQFYLNKEIERLSND